MRILVIGATGMLGHAVLPALGERHQVTGLGSAECDICDASAVYGTLRRFRPDLVMNLAAFTDVDGCEKTPQKAERVNGVGAGHIARGCKEIGAAMLHISTDYVFSGGKSGAYLEDDPTGPVSEYGRSKLIGEQEVAGNLDRHFIVRTSWLFGTHGKNFVDTILRIARQQPELRVVNDQRGSPTYTRHLAEKLANIIDKNDYGIYHVTGSGNCSWFEFAQGIIGMAGIERVRVIPVTSAEYVRPARRPANSVLENGHLRRLHIDPAPHWEDALRSYLEEIGCQAGCETAGKIEATWKAN